MVFYIDEKEHRYNDKENNIQGSYYLIHDNNERNKFIEILQKEIFNEDKIRTECKNLTDKIYISTERIYERSENDCLYLQSQDFSTCVNKLFKQFSVVSYISFIGATENPIPRFLAKISGVLKVG